MGTTNMNLVRLNNSLDQLKGAVQARMERSRDADGCPNSDLFKIKNPDITDSMGEWIKAQTAEGPKPAEPDRRLPQDR